MKLKISALVALALASSGSLGAAEKITTDTVNVVSTTPLPSIGLPIDLIPANIQMIKSKQVNNQAGVSIADYMANNLQGVNVNTTQGNPFQPDLTFRGFMASPLIGAPQGISVFVDGVRVNEPFGDVVNWDLIPNFSMKSMQIIPGSNPVYGLNTLGGAISIQTKDGRTSPGAAVEAEVGSWGRRRALVEYGGVSKDGSVDYYFGGQHTAEDGWRNFSPSRVNQTFGKVGWQNSASKLNLSYMGADNSMTGNGLTPVALLTGDRDQIHTRPDTTDNNLNHITLNGSNWINDTTQISLNGFYRKSNRKSLNGDLNDEFNTGDAFELFAATTKQALTNGFTATSPQMDADGNTSGSSLGTIVTRFRSDNPASSTQGQNLVCEAVLINGDDVCAPGSINRNHTKQRIFGGTLQAAFNQDIFGKKNQLITGLGYEQSMIKHTSSEQKSNVEDMTFAQIRDQGNALFFDSSRSLINLGTIDQTVNLHGKTRTYSVFATDTISLNDKFHVTAAARYNTTNVKNDDQINPTGDASLSGNHTFNRLNPSIGAVLMPFDKLSVFGNYSESSRAPTSIELGCANPARPCLLPNAMAGDPPLNQVVAKTVDFGLRGKITPNVNWSASVYNTQNYNDIQFMWSGSGSRGYFSNVGQTNRRGLDLNLNGKYEKLGFNLNYSYIDASYDSTFKVVSPANSTRNSTDDPYTTVQPGDQLPGISPNQLKLRLSYDVMPNWIVGANIINYSSQYVFGNENNDHSPTSSRPGMPKLAGYSIVNLDTQYDFGSGWKMFAKAINIFDKDYNAAGRLGETQIISSGAWQGLSEQRVGMVVPGAPRAAWIGFRYEFGGAPEAK